MVINGNGLCYSRTIETQGSPPVIIGADIGQKIDPTAIAVVEAFETERFDRRQEYRFETRHLERLPIGTSYPDIGKRVAAIVAGIQNRQRPANVRTPKITLVVDATGVGTPACDIIRGELAREGLTITLTEAIFTFGRSLKGRAGMPSLVVGKEYLVSRLQSLAQTDRVYLPPDHAEAAAMMRELQDYEIRTDPDGDAKFGAFKTGRHDDLVTALGLAVVSDPPKRGRLQGW